MSVVDEYLESWKAEVEAQEGARGVGMFIAWAHDKPISRGRVKMLAVPLRQYNFKRTPEAAKLESRLKRAEEFADPDARRRARNRRKKARKHSL